MKQVCEKKMRKGFFDDLIILSFEGSFNKYTFLVLHGQDLIIYYITFVNECICLDKILDYKRFLM